MERHQARFRSRPTFNVIALMDVFTVLVFFLLVNSSAVDPLQDESIKLPESAAEQLPREALVVTITSTAVLLGGTEIADAETVLTASSGEIAPLRDALLALPKPESAVNEEAPLATTGEVTIMADKSIPFTLLKRVMTTCARAGYEQITLSVLQKPAARS
jgi:biopolymer transport protein ExbD